MNSNTTILAHVNSDIVTRQQLAALPPPTIDSETFRPVPHIELIEGLDQVLAQRSIRIIHEQYALRRDGNALFGVAKVEFENGITREGIAAIGIRQANDKTMSIQICAGLSVFVCDNLAFRGDMIALKRKHTSGLNLLDELNVAVGRFLNHFDVLKSEVEYLQTRQLQDGQAKSLIHDAFVGGLMPVRYLPAVSKAYFEPPHVEFEPRNAWSLHNAFTEVAKQMPVTTRITATQELGRFFGMRENALPGEVIDAA